MNRNVLLILAVAIALAAAAVYGINRPGGNEAVASICTGAPEAAAGLGELVTGEVAAFQLARKPQDLTALAFSGSDGAPMTMAEFAGKVTLVNLWATWCAPCRREMPALDQLQEDRGGDDFQVVTINIDTGEWDRPQQFLDSIEIEHLPHYRDRTTGIFQEMKTRGLALGLPVTVLADRSGCLLGHINGPAEWHSPDALRLIDAARDAV